MTLDTLQQKNNWAKYIISSEKNVHENNNSVYSSLLKQSVPNFPVECL